MACDYPLRLDYVNIDQGRRMTQTDFPDFEVSFLALEQHNYLSTSQEL